MKWITRDEAQQQIEENLGHRIVVDAFDQRDHGSDRDVTVVYYSFIDDSPRAEGGRSFVRWCVRVFIDGEPASDTEVPRREPVLS